jgi:hypothetical protein
MTTSLLISYAVELFFIAHPSLSLFRLLIAKTIFPLCAILYIFFSLGLTLSTWPGLKILKQSEFTRISSKSLIDMTSIPVIRQRRASSIEVPLNQNGIHHSSIKTRRKSLPALVPSRVSR